MKKIKNRFIKLFMAICLVFVSVFAFTQANAISVVLQNEYRFRVCKYNN